MHSQPVAESPTRRLSLLMAVPTSGALYVDGNPQAAAVVRGTTML
eukprot:SAG31_NODE_44267_length_263_cov_0.951220_1_plen_44_part_01